MTKIFVSYDVSGRFQEFRVAMRALDYRDVFPLGGELRPLPSSTLVAETGSERGVIAHLHAVARNLGVRVERAIVVSGVSMDLWSP